MLYLRICVPGCQIVVVSLTVAVKIDISLFLMMLLAHRQTLVEYMYKKI